MPLIRPRLAAAAATVSAVCALAAQPVAVADPATSTDCTPDLAGVSTKRFEAEVVVLCKNGMWYPQPADAPPSDRWVSFGPTLSLHGQALPNPNVLQGTWNAVPLGPWTRCRSVQQTGVAAGAVSKPSVDQGPPNAPMTFDVITNVVSIQFSGYCLWVRQPGSGPNGT